MHRPFTATMSAVTAVAIGLGLGPPAAATVSADDLAFSARALASSSVGPAAKASPGKRVIVQWKQDSNRAQRTRVRAQAKAVSTLTLGEPHWQVLTLSDDASAKAVARRMSADPAVRGAEPDFPVQLHDEATDPLWPFLWGLKNTGQKYAGVANGTPGADIDVSTAWDKTLGSPTTVVAVIDDGYRFDHPDLVGNAWANPDEIANGEDDDGNGIIDDLRGAEFTGTGDGDPTDDYKYGVGHGTHVTATIAAQRNNNIGIAGVAPNVRVMPLRVCGGTPYACDASAMLRAIHYAGTKGARVVNMSMGTASDTTLFRDAMARWPATLFVVSAGNDGFNNDLAYDAGRKGLNPIHPCVDNPADSNLPGAIDNVVCVAATTQTDDWASFSNWGATTVDVAAPGTEIISAVTSTLVRRTPIESDSTFDGWENSGFQLVETLDGNWWHYARPLTQGATMSLVSRPVSVTGPAYCRMTASVGAMPTFNAAGFTWAPVIDGVVGSANQVKEFMWPLTADSPGAHSIGVKFSYTQGASTTGALLLRDYVVRCYEAPGTERFGSFDILAGTSMASPHVAGTAALLASYEPKASTAQLRTAVLASVDTIADFKTGAHPISAGGRADANKALLEIDKLVAPDTAITRVSPDTGISATSVSIEFAQAGSQAPIGTYECSVHGLSSPPTFSDCTSPFVVSTADSVTKRFSVRAVDTYGNVDPSPAVQQLRVDNTAPETTLGDSGPRERSSSTTAQFTFTSNESDVSFECRRDYSDYEPCVSPRELVGLGDGPHTFEVRAKDAAGNVDETQAGRNWSVDTVAPSVSITEGPSDSTSTTASISMSANEPASFECQLDAGPAGACTSPVTFSGLVPGGHTVKVSAIDAVGLRGDSVAWSWTVIPADADPDVSHPAAPANLVVKSRKSPGRAVATWQTTPGATSYKVRISRGNSTKRFGTWRTTTRNRAIFTNLKPRVRYTVQVRAVGGEGSGPAAQIRFKQVT